MTCPADLPPPAVSLPGAALGVAIRASVSDEVDAKLREQIRAGVFPVRLAPADWTLGETAWLLDVIAPDKKAAAAVIANFRQVAGVRELRLHPLVPRLVEPEVLDRIGTVKTAPSRDDGNTEDQEGSP